MAQYLLGLQRRYGNQYLKRVLAPARERSGDMKPTPEVEAIIERERGGGNGLDNGTRAEMETFFGADFDGVRIHTDSNADALNHDVNAIAFTTGHDIFFRHGTYRPGTSTGKELLAHELTHVVQESGAAVERKLVLGDPEDASEKEAERVAREISRRADLDSLGGIQRQCACGGQIDECNDCAARATAHGADRSKYREPLATTTPEFTEVRRQSSGETGAGVGPTSAPVVNAGPPAPVPTSGGCTTQPPAKDPRAVFDDLCLLSDDLKNDPRLNDAVHNNPPLTAQDNGLGGPVQRFQQALLDVGERLPNYGADGNWGQETTNAVASFQGKHGIPPGGFEAGRKTLAALDEQLQNKPPGPPTPPPPQNATLAAQCGTAEQADKVIVSGTGFPPGFVNLLVDGAGGNSALVNANGALTGSVPAKLKDGSHVVEAVAGSVHAATQFTTPCGGPQPTPVDPSVVTQNELIVLTKYQFLGQTERDATEDAIRDLKGKIDPTPVPWGRALAEVIGETAIQFVYGAFEQVMLDAIKGAVLPSQQSIVNQGNDKASDFLEDFGKDGLKEAIEKEDQAPTKAVEEQVEIFRRSQLASLRKGYLQLELGWIQKIEADPNTANITPDALQGLATALDETAETMYRSRYNNVIEAWNSYIAHSKLGGRVVTLQVNGRPPEVFVTTNLTNIDDKDPKDVPGVLLIGLTVPDAHSEANEDDQVRMNQDDVHIFGMSEETRKQLGASHPQLTDLHMPVALRGEPRTGGLVAIGKNETGGIVDAGSDAKGKQWLIAVGQAKKRDPSLSDPNLGAEAVFQDDLDAQKIEKDIKGP
ncbi:MAG: DUF4157 domain-containing protein [Acidobacteriaceae bacterium]|nr:DUF4157 domain-containing protein [Acidobacteriaceae bacterium]MBV9778547.1 DUF4157 domain-containing protein [Acidobacteriaceae bacterium]